MKITISFAMEPGDIEDYKKLDGKTVTMADVDHFHFNAAIDIFQYTDEKGQIVREPMDTGSINLTAHGDRAMWNEGKEPEAT